MALDRFIHFGKKQPTREEVDSLLRLFLGEWPSEIVWNPRSCYITVPGKPAEEHILYREERWIEIYIGDKNIDVLTREQDPLVCAIATGLAKYLAHRLRGQLEKGH
jgi:hypothetical protein